jgi:hypothetical protein
MVQAILSGGRPFSSGTAHAELGVELSVLQTGYVVVVIAIAPILASVLLTLGLTVLH